VAVGVKRTEATAFSIASEYEFVPATNDGDSEPEDGVSAPKVDTDEPARAAFTMYVVVAVLLVTTMLMTVVAPPES